LESSTASATFATRGDASYTGTDLAGFVQASVVVGKGSLVVMLHDDHPRVIQEGQAVDLFQHRRIYVDPIRRVEQYDAERFASLAQRFERRAHFATHHFCLIGGLQLLQVGLDGLHRSSAPLYECDLGCASGDGLQTQGAAAGKQIQNSGTGKQRRQDVEKRLLEPAAGRACR